MVLRQKREAEYDNERGWFVPALLRAGWIILVAGVSWYIAQWLLFESGVLTIQELYQGGFSRSLSEDVLVYIMTAAVFLIINIFILIGYFLALPSGRRRADRPTTYSRKPDYRR